MSAQYGERLPSEAVRVREVYRYFQPATIKDASQQKEPTSPDPALTSFAQLLALRLNAQRAMISVIDHRVQYFIAESTRSLDVLDNAIHAIEDELWVGCGAVGRTGRLCERTLDMTPGNEEEEFPVFTVNDLTLDPRFSHWDFVTGPPRLRFYAGVPLRTPAGINIGSVCIVDDQPRQYLSPKDARFLSSIACAVMRYFEKCREVEDQRLTTRIAQAVQTFNLGGSNLDEVVPQHTGRSTAGADTTETLIELDESNSVALGPTFSRAANLACQALQIDGVVYFDTVGTSEGPVPSAADASQSSTSMQDESAADSSAFQNSSESGSVSQAASRPTNLSDTSLSSTAPFPKSGSSDRRKARVHAFSTPTGGSMSGDLAINATGFSAVNSRFLRKLIDHFPKGRVFSFWNGEYVPPIEEDGVSDETGMSVYAQKRVAEEREEAMRLRSYFGSATQIAFVPIWDTSTVSWIAASFAWSTSETRIFAPHHEHSFLVTLGHSIMAELGRLNVARSDQAKGGFISSISHELRSPLHGILASVDFLTESHLDNFQQNLVSNVESCGRTLLDTLENVLYFSRIGQFTKETQEPGLDNEKSPIVTALLSKAAVNGVDNRHRNVLAQIDASRDTEEVLDVVYAGLAYSHRAEERLLDDGLFMSSLNRAKSDNLGTRGYKKNTNVVIIVDIAYNDNWQFFIFSGGWKRILMNLFANSMKYTTEGWIKIRLEQIDRCPEEHCQNIDSCDPTDPRISVLKLRVSDSGKGMSQDFVDNKLFVPFLQESSLSPGTGLGMSIVKQITDVMGGTIDAQSIKGKGSEIEVTIPVKKAPVYESDSPAPPAAGLTTKHDSLIRQVRSMARGRRVAMYGFPPGDTPLQSNAMRGLTSSIERCLVEWFQVEVVTADSWNRSGADIVLVEDDDSILDYVEYGKSNLEGKSSALADLDEPGQAKGSALLVLCRHTSKFPPAAAGFTDGVLGFVKEPLGPWKLGAALLRCFEGLAKIEGKTGHSKPFSAAEQIAEEQGLPTIINHEEDSRSVFLATVPPKAAEQSNATTYPESDVAGVSLPIRSATPQHSDRPATPRSSKQAPASTPAASESSYNGPRILLVEDNAINLMLLSTYMRKKKFEYKTAVDGLYALEAVRESDKGFDVIFMDLSMPRMDGFQSTRAIRKYEQQLMQAEGRTKFKRPARIIALTGLSSASDEKEALASGCDVFLVKPVKFAIVERYLKEWGFYPE